MAEQFWDMSLEALFPATWRGNVISVDDLIDALTRCAALAGSAVYAIENNHKIALDERLKQIMEEALDAIGRAERGEVF